MKQALFLKSYKPRVYDFCFQDRNYHAKIEETSLGETQRKQGWGKSPGEGEMSKGVMGTESAFDSLREQFPDPIRTGYWLKAGL